MKKLFVTMALMSVLAISGCAIFDALTGVGKPKEDGSIAKTVTDTGSNMPGIVGGVFGILGSLAAVYKTWRERQLAAQNGILQTDNTNFTQALDSVITAIEHAYANKDSVTWVEMKDALIRLKNEKMNDPDFMTQFAAKVKEAYQAISTQS